MKRITGITRSMFSGLAFLLSLVAAAWLLICFAASIVPPAEVKFLALFSLTTPFAILANIIFLVVHLLSRHKARMFVPILALAITYRLSFSIFGLSVWPNADTRFGENSIRIMEWNVHGLGIYDRPLDKESPEKMVRVIQQYQPDILCLIEFYTLLEDGLEPHGKMFLEGLGYKEYRFSYDNTLGSKIFIGNAIFSKFPLRNFKTHKIGEYTQLMQCDIELPGKKKMRGFFFHLQSFHLGQEDKEFLEAAGRQPELAKQHYGRSKSYLSKFNHNYVLRAQQAEKIKQHISRSPYPVLICADFNDLPSSYTYTTIRGQMCDAYEDKGFGLGRTYNRISPTLRIDYILYDNDYLDITDCITPVTKLSDHNPVIATFRLR